LAQSWVLRMVGKKVRPTDDLWAGQMAHQREHCSAHRWALQLVALKVLHWASELADPMVPLTADCWDFLLAHS
jgi:hypothetical protein